MEPIGQDRPRRLPWVRPFLVGLGTFFVGLGIVGIFIPVLPTTPFFLLAAACYARSSDRTYHWLLNHRWFGKYIRDYREGRGIPRRAKGLSIGMLWTTVLVSLLVLPHPLLVKVLLLAIALGVTIYLLSLPTSPGGSEGGLHADPRASSKHLDKGRGG
ncbi:MAG: YbaN family protein [Desulfobacterota bacterium]|nr:YbaN family protein [Thermodesulfobacteriota bacterium]